MKIEDTWVEPGFARYDSSLLSITHENDANIEIKLSLKEYEADSGTIVSLKLPNFMSDNNGDEEFVRGILLWVVGYVVSQHLNESADMTCSSFFWQVTDLNIEEESHLKRCVEGLLKSPIQLEIDASQCNHLDQDSYMSACSIVQNDLSIKGVYTPQFLIGVFAAPNKKDGD